MALIPCKECGKEISDKAVTCPNCGIPIPKEIGKNKENDLTPYKGLKFKSYPTYCRKCRTPIKWEQNFCQTCGTYFPCHENNTFIFLLFLVGIIGCLLILFFD